MFRFVISLLVLSAVIVGVFLLGLNQGHFTYPSFLRETLLFVILITAIIYYYLSRGHSPDIFVRLYLLFMVLKLVASCCYIIFMIVKDQPGTRANVAFFMVAYFLFTALEIVFLNRKIRRGNNP